jgi:hypothetical protein
VDSTWDAENRLDSSWVTDLARSWRRSSLVAWVGVVLAWSTPGSADDAEPATDEVDAGPAIASPGKWVELAARPDAAAWPSVCSFRHAICVHSTNSSRLNEALADVERAWEQISFSLGLPEPLPARDTGAFDLYLEARLGEETSIFERDPRAGLDRASTFARVDVRLRGCSLEAAIARRVLAASAYRVAPAMDAATLEGTTSALARLMTPCAITTDTAAMGAAQLHPESAIDDPTDTTGARASGLLFAWLDDAFAPTPGSSIVATWALSPTHTDHAAQRWNGKPDAFDVLRETFKGALFERSTLEDLFVDFGVARSFVGSAADETHFLESRGFGDAGKVALAWDIPWPEKARRLVAPTGIQPTGSSFVLVHREGAKPGTSLRIESDWEELMKLRWVAVKLDAHGREIARIPVAAAGKTTHAALTLGELDTTATVLLVGTNVGEWTRPFDPDEAPWEPHGYMITLASE